MNEKKTNQTSVNSTYKERVQMETTAGLRQAIVYLAYVMRSRYEISDHEMFDAVLRNVIDLGNHYLRIPRAWKKQPRRCGHPGSAATVLFLISRGTSVPDCGN